MWLNDNRFRDYRETILFVGCVFLIAVILKVCGDKEVPQKDIVPETTVVEITFIPSSTPIPCTPTPIPTITSVPTPTSEPKRENTLYYVYEERYDSRHDLDIKYQDYLYEMCVKYGIPEYYELLFAQMYHESRFKINLISKTNDYGLMQINTCNHNWLSKKLGSDDFLDPYVSIEAGVYMMSNYLEKYNDAHKALVCYNSGESKVRKGTYSTKYSKCVIDDLNKLVELEEQKGEIK